MKKDIIGDQCRAFIAHRNSQSVWGVFGYADLNEAGQKETYFRRQRLQAEEH